jgi:hypothetical protein
MRIYDDKQRPNLEDTGLISVNVDASDLTAASAEPLRSILSRFGRPVVSKAFADFQQATFADLSIQFYQMGFALVHCPSWPNGDGHLKFIVSDVMAQDLRDQLEDLEEIDTFVLVATSRDYIAVANALRRHDKRVVVVAEETKVSRELRLCADEFIALPPGRQERASRYARVERAEAPKMERVEAPRPERPEPLKAERVEPPKPERAEAPKIERVEPARPDRVEAQDGMKLPTDAEVIAEVKKIVAAEGICTPRRLAKALCPVDRTATGELRSRIANRVQTMIDAGKLQRDKLVVGGTSVETILAGEDRGARPSAPAPESAPEQQPAAPPARSSRRRKKAEPAPAASQEPGAMIQGDRVGPPEESSQAADQSQNGGERVHALDALVETVLMSPELAAQLLHKGPERQAVKSEQSQEEGTVEPAPADADSRQPAAPPAGEASGGETPVVEESAAQEPGQLESPEAAPAVQEKPKRSRSRRKPAPKPAAEDGGANRANG